MKEEIDFFDCNSTSRSSNKRLTILQSKRGNLATNSYNEFGFDYFDNIDLGIGYGGYNYDARYEGSAKKMIEYYNLKNGSKVLEIGCAKGFVLIEFMKQGMEVVGTEISRYAIENSLPELTGCIIEVSSNLLPFRDNFFDFIYSKEVFPHIEQSNLKELIHEINRVGKDAKFLEIQVAESKAQKALIEKWDPTHKILESSAWWKEFLIENNYHGDYHFKTLF